MLVVENFYLSRLLSRPFGEVLRTFCFPRFPDIKRKAVSILDAESTILAHPMFGMQEIYF